MHCSADLTEAQAAADSDNDEAWDSAEETPPAAETATGSDSATPAADGTSVDTPDPIDASTIVESLGIGGEGQLLDPDGIVDNALTIAVGIGGGVVVGLVGTIVLGVATGSVWAIPFGVLAWLGSTAHLVRQRTVQGAISKTGYAIAIVLLAIPLITLSPAVTIDGGLAGRGASFLILLVSMAFPASIAAAIGWIAGRFVPDAADA
jgi:hypothetical protein